MVRQFAIVPGASTGIGYEFARICAREGFDLLVAADEVEIEKAAADLRREPGAEVVEARHLDLAKQEDIDKLHAAIRGRPIDVLTANLRRVVHRLKAAGRRAGNRGLSEFTVVCASRGASRFRNQRDLPHAGRDRDRVSDMLDTKVGSEDKDDPAMVARQGFDAMVKGECDVVQSAVANATPAEMLAKQHRKMAEPGSAKH